MTDKTLRLVNSPLCIGHASVIENVRASMLAIGRAEDWLARKAFKTTNEKQNSINPPTGD